MPRRRKRLMVPSLPRSGCGRDRDTAIASSQRGAEADAGTTADFAGGVKGSLHARSHSPGTPLEEGTWISATTTESNGVGTAVPAQEYRATNRDNSCSSSGSVAGPYSNNG